MLKKEMGFRRNLSQAKHPRMNSIEQAPENKNSRVNASMIKSILEKRNTHLKQVKFKQKLYL